MRARSFLFEIFTISLAAVLLEISYTRIFSFKVYYYFTYLILGIALLGIGAGGSLLAVSDRLRAVAPERLVPALGLVAAAAVGLGYFAIAPAPLNVSEIVFHRVEVLKLAAVCLALLIPFLAAGIAVSTILGCDTDRVARLYGADLCGAGLACVASIPLLYLLTPPGCVMLAGLCFALAGLPLALAGAPGRRGVLGPKGRVAGIALVAGLVLAVLGHDRLPDPTTDRMKQVARFKDSGQLLASRWNPVFRVDVLERPFEPDKSVLLSHDGWMGSAIHRFDGDWSRLEPMREGPPSVPFSALGPSPTVLVIGAAGGHEVLASLFFGASEVTGVELNSATVDLLTGRFADFAGRIHEDPRVHIVNAEARSFLQRGDQRWDLIWLVAPDSYAAMNAASSAAFVLSESYLYTVEMIREALSHLNEGGVLAAQFGERDYRGKPNRTLRYVATAREALAQEGVDDFGDHLLVATADGLPPMSNSTILLSRKPFSAEQRQRFEENARQLKGGVARWLPGRAPDHSRLGELVTTPSEALPAWFEAQPYDLTPVRDDSPYFWHFTRYRDALRPSVRPGARGLDWEDTIGEQVTVVLLAIVTLMAALFLLLPFVAIRDVWLGIPAKATAGVYFASLGLGFMFLEVSLIQRFTLFLGYPTYSLSVTLFSLLTSSGAGSLLAGRWTGSGGGSPSVLLFTLGGLLALHQLAVPGIFAAFAGAPEALRIGVAIGSIAPLGLCLGAFMPIGLARIASLSAHRREYIAWAWAVNGFFSVIASILSTILAMMVGFQVLLGLAFAIYVVAVLALGRLSAEASTA